MVTHYFSYFFLGGIGTVVSECPDEVFPEWKL